MTDINRSTTTFVVVLFSTGELCPSGDNSNWYMTDTACYFVSPLLNDSLHFDWTTAKQYCANLMPEKGTQLMSLTTSGDAVNRT